MNNLVSLQEKVDKLISVMGTSRACDFLDLVVAEGDKKKRISNLISLIACNHFEVTIEELTSKVKATDKVARCRSICYVMHRDFLNLSIRKIGKVYNKTENVTMLAMRRVDDALSNIRIDPKVYQDYHIIKKTIEDFIKYTPDDKA